MEQELAQFTSKVPILQRYQFNHNTKRHRYSHSKLWRRLLPRLQFPFQFRLALLFLSTQMFHSVFRGPFTTLHPLLRLLSTHRFHPPRQIQVQNLLPALHRRQTTIWIDNRRHLMLWPQGETACSLVERVSHPCCGIGEHADVIMSSNLAS